MAVTIQQSVRRCPNTREIEAYLPTDLFETLPFDSDSNRIVHVICIDFRIHNVQVNTVPCLSVIGQRVCALIITAIEEGAFDALAGVERRQHGVHVHYDGNRVSNNASQG